MPALAWRAGSGRRWCHHPPDSILFVSLAPAVATGVKGLQLAGAPTYVTDLFNGAALIIAVALAARSARKA